MTVDEHSEALRQSLEAVERDAEQAVEDVVRYFAVRVVPAAVAICLVTWLAARMWQRRGGEIQ